MKTLRTLATLAGLAFSTSAIAVTLQDDTDGDGRGDIFFSGGSALAY